MTLLDVFLELLKRLGLEKEFCFAWDWARHWPDDAMKNLMAAKLIKVANPASEIECPGCAECCIATVEVRPGSAFVVCGDSEIGRVKVDSRYLAQWSISRAMLASWLAKELRINIKPEPDKSSGDFVLGKFMGKKRESLLVLGFADGVVLKAGGHVWPVAEVLICGLSGISIDLQAAVNLVDLPVVVDKKPRYQPSEIKRQYGKLNTAERNKKWRTEYRKLKKANPDKSDTWISKKIANMPVAEGKDSETIRKNMIR